MKVLELNCFAIPLTAVGGGGILEVPGEAVAGPSRATHLSDSCGTGLTEIAADFESLEVVSAIPAESIGFSPDGRIRFPGKPICAVPSKTDVPPRLPLDLTEVPSKLEAVLDKPRSSRSLEEEFGVDPGVGATEAEYNEGPRAAGEPCPRAAHSTHPSRVPWNYHRDAREESAEGLDDSSQGVFENSATSASPLRPLPNFTRGRRDGRGTLRVRAPACYAVPDLRNTQDGTSITDPETANFSCDLESWAWGRNTSETTAKDIISARISFPAGAAIVPLLDCFLHAWRTIFATLRTPTRLATTLRSLL